MGKSRTQYATLNIASSFAGYFINTVVGFACRMVFVRCLTEEHLGVAGLFTSIILMLSLSELGLGAVMTHALYDPIARHDKQKIAGLIRYFAKIHRVIFGFIIIAGLALVPFLNVFVNERPSIDENFTLIYLLFVFSSALSYLFGHYSLFLRASQKDYVIAAVTYATTIIQSCVQIIVLLQTRNYIYYLIIQIFCLVLQSLFIASLVRRKNRYLYKGHEIQELSKEEKKNLFKNIYVLSLGKLSGFVVNGTDNIIIAKLVGIASVGLLSNYILLIGIIDALIRSFISSISGGIGNFNALSEKKATARLFHNISFIVFLVYGWSGVVLYLCANDLIGLLFGDRYVMGQVICSLLVANSFMFGMIVVVGVFMDSVGVFAKGRLVVVVTSILNVLLSILFGLRWGVMGVLAATVVARFVTNWWYQPRALFKYGFEESSRKYFINYFTFTGLIVVSVMLASIINNQFEVGSKVIDITVRSLYASVIFLTGVYVVYRKSDELRYFMEKLRYVHRQLRIRIFPY